MQAVETGASSADEGEGEDEIDMDEDEDEELEKKEVAAASKRYSFPSQINRECLTCICSALAALSKVKDVDIKGGWKVGDPCALFSHSIHHVLIFFAESLMPLSPKRSL